MATRLYDAEQDDQLKQESTGHHSNSVHGYKNATDSLRRKADRKYRVQNMCCSKVVSKERSKLQVK